MVEAIVSHSSLKRKRGSVVSGSVTVEEESIKRRCGEKRSVRFSSHTREEAALNYLGGLSPAEEEQLRRKLWYSGPDFERFLQDRMQTIRIWRAVGGNSRLIEPNYCLRGLETFQSALTNGEMQMLRSRHVAAVLNEKERQRTTGVVDAELVAQASKQCSAYSRERAARFGVKDAVEAQQACQMGTSSSNSRSSRPTENNINKPRQQQQMSCCFSAPQLFHQNKTPAAFHPMMPKLSASSQASAASRQSLTQLSMLGRSLRPRRSSVDVTKLKQLNMQFLRSLAQSETSSSPPAASTTTATVPSHIAPTGPATKALTGASSSSFGSIGTLDLLNEALEATTSSF